MLHRFRTHTFSKMVETSNCLSQVIIDYQPKVWLVVILLIVFGILNFQCWGWFLLVSSHGSHETPNHLQIGVEAPQQTYAWRSRLPRGGGPVPGYLW